MFSKPPCLSSTATFQPLRRERMICPKKLKGSCHRSTVLSLVYLRKRTYAERTFSSRPSNVRLVPSDLLIPLAITCFNRQRNLQPVVATKPRNYRLLLLVHILHSAARLPSNKYPFFKGLESVSDVALTFTRICLPSDAFQHAQTHLFVVNPVVLAPEDALAICFGQQRPVLALLLFDNPAIHHIRKGEASC